MKNINKFDLPKSVGPNSQSVKKIDCHAAVSLEKASPCLCSHNWPAF